MTTTSSNNTNTNTNTNTTITINKNTKSVYQARLGVQGVRLKKFEEVVCDCISNSEVIPKYVPLPNAPSPERLLLIDQAVRQSSSSSSSLSDYDSYNNNHNKDITNDNDVDDDTVPPPSFPFDILPSAACVRIPKSCYNYRPSYEQYTLGKLSGIRALRKEWQLSSMIQCLLAMLSTNVLGEEEGTDETISSSSSSSNDRIKIVDFAGGTGHLALPLALMLPKCDIILVDLKGTSLELVHEKAKDLMIPPSEHKEMQQHDLFLPPGYNESESIRNGNTQKTPRNDNGDESQTSDSLKSETIITTDTATTTNTTNKKKEKKKKPRRKPKSASRDVDVTCHANIVQQSQHIPNLYTYHGSITTYAQEHKFDIGLSLHCCGEGTDLVLRACGEAKANFIVCPCCVGKLSSQKRNPYVYHATSGNEATVSYPQSSIFRQLIPDNVKFDALAKAADYSDFQDMRTSRNATRRTAKALLEYDRIFMCKEEFGYDDVVLTRMSPWEASPKNDILLGWFNDTKKCITMPYDHCGGDVKNLQPDDDCNTDIELAMNQLLSPNDINRNVSNHECNSVDEGPNTDWSIDEIKKYRSVLDDFIASDEQIFRFPTRMGSRLRKLVHYHAEKMNLRHWPEGKKVSEKIVVIAKKKK